MTVPLTLEHLLWRMEHVHSGSEVVAAGARVRFPDLAHAIRRLSAGLDERFGIGRGDTVGVLAFNTLEHLELMYAVPILGATLSSLNVRLSCEMLIAQARRDGLRLLVVDEEVLTHRSIGPAARAAVEELAHDGLRIVKASALENIAQTTAEASEKTRGTAAVTPREDAPAFLFHTSGTTGVPKSYRVTHRDVVLHALSQSSADASGLRAGDRVLPLVPFCHVNGWGLPFTAALTGAALVLPGGDLAPQRVTQLLTVERVTVAAAVPTVWFDVCRHVSEHSLAAPLALREVLTGGSVVPRSVVDLVHDVLGASVATAWGMTETLAVSTYERDDPSSRAGRFIPLVEGRIVGADGSPGPAGENGTLEVRGPFVVGGRDGAPGGWFDTGDVASLDEAGRLALHDRHKDLIKSGGEWIISAQLEQHLCTHPSVSAAAVVARPDPKWTERPVAVLVPRQGGQVDETELRAHLAERFPPFWVPDVFICVEHLPLTPVGKVDKRALRARHAAVSHDTTGGAP
ncbi:AMP-binding protein [Amycolatopsis taiwanensis]|uniref:Long-chain-fatty-acid--CoA ligase n=1 Tax=Amycolatopsis taiwanensis TaxID=342230 RepID=A0A9W6VGB5_9PSEU|nr:AMP-binding protein [Amycolatopsis taiwanensis]GLY70598.1 long-chain-fatty-acid--CoA ligase [Amycolatopsis taiwanensis]